MTIPYLSILDQSSLKKVRKNGTLVCKAKNINHTQSHLYLWEWEFRGNKLRKSHKHVMVYEIAPPNPCGQSEGWTALFVTEGTRHDLGRYSCSLVRSNVTLGKAEALLTGMQS